MHESGVVVAMSKLECGVCGRSFYKPEHLRRHERRHTGSRPYSCKTCGRAFSRQDSLLRHARLHERPRDNPYASPPSSVGAQTSSPDEALRSTQSSPLDFPASNKPRLYDVTDPHVESHSAHSVDHADHNTTEASLPAIDLDLMWPDSEDLFQALLTSTDGKEWQSPLGPSCIGTPTSTFSPVASHSRFGDQPPSIDSIPLGANNRAVDEVSAMISAQVSALWFICFCAFCG